MQKLITLIKRLLVISLSIIAVLVVATFLYMKQPIFGKAPNGDRLNRVSSSKNYVDGSFRNLEITPDLTEGYSYLGIMYDQFFGNNPRTKPASVIPSTKTDLMNLSPDENILVWFGHSSYFMQLQGKTILVDPVFSGNASPIPGTVKAFPGTDQYTVDDLPDIDYLIISHDHYDHLDHQTITQLRDKVSTVFCGLGVGSHFTHWGYSDDQINEQDWHDVAKPDSAITIHTLPARHFSGRGFARKNTLWASYLVQTPSLNIYIGGDSGFGEFFAEIGEQFGSIDLAILDNGQYNDAWREIHLHPEEVLQAARHLKAKRLFPVHSSKFVLAMHPWDEPLYRLKALNRENPIPLVTPLIGEKVNLADPTQSFESWWEGLD